MRTAQNGMANRTIECPRIFGPVGCIAVFLLLGCGGGLEPYRPHRPGPAFRPEVALFPERTLLEVRDETPPETLARIDAVFREIAQAETPEERGIRGELAAELDSIEAAIRRIPIGAGAVMRLRLGTPTTEETAEFRRAAALSTRLALAKMRVGNADSRVRGAQILSEARTWDPADPLLALVQATYLEMAGFRSNSLRALDEFEREHGAHGVVTLSRFRRNLRDWILSGDQAAADRAEEIGAQMVQEAGGWEEAPSWLLGEMARLAFLTDSLGRAEELAGRILERQELGEVGRAAPVLSAHLLLGLLEVHRFEHERADPHFAAAAELARRSAEDEDLALLLSVPWDLWTDVEQAEYDRSLAQIDWIEDYWRRYDPITATPRLSENRIDYLARVAEAHLRFEGVDLRNSGPSTEPGRVLLRFGRPDRWERLGSPPQEPGGEDRVFDFAVHPSWRFVYDWTGADGVATPREIRFEDRSGARGYYVATDSLRPPAWPAYRFDDGFLGRAYPFDADVARFRNPAGGTRVFLSFDSVLPNYAVRFPLQGLRFEGTATVQCALLREIGGDRWVVEREERLLLDRERIDWDEREFRRRGGRLLLDGLVPGRYRVPAFLRLRDEEGRTLHVGIHDSTSFSAAVFGEDGLDASDLLVTSELSGLVQAETERELAPDWVAYGPELDAFGIWPRASRRFLAGENLAYYLELYALAQREGVVNVDLEVSLQKLDVDGEVEYEVVLGESRDRLIKFGVRQWNVARSFGLGTLAPGRYRLALAAFDRVGRRRVNREADFEVLPAAEMIAYYRWPSLPAPDVGVGANGKRHRANESGASGKAPAPGASRSTRATDGDGEEAAP